MHTRLPELSCVTLGRVFSISDKTVASYRRRAASGKGLAESPRPGSAPKLNEMHLAWLKTELEADPTLSSYALTERFNKRYRRNQVHRSTILRAIHALGMTQKKRPRSRRSKHDLK